MEEPSVPHSPPSELAQDPCADVVDKDNTTPAALTEGGAEKAATNERGSQEGSVQSPSVPLTSDQDANSASNLPEEQPGVSSGEHESGREIRKDSLQDEVVRRSRPRASALSHQITLVYEEHLRLLKKRTPTGIPDVYAILKTFWLPYTAPYFSAAHLIDNRLPPPRFFFWDPMYLVVGGLRCPGCHRAFVRHCFAGPRKVLDVDGWWYLIGQRYRCSTCINPRTGEKQITYTSWDQIILDLLPSALRQEFPIRFLTVQSWVSDALYDLMRGCEEAGLSQQKFLTVVKAIDKRNVDELEEGTPTSRKKQKRQSSYTLTTDI